MINDLKVTINGSYLKKVNKPCFKVGLGVRSHRRNLPGAGSVKKCSPGGMMREIMLVPLPLAASSDLISFFTFQISTFLSAASTVVSDILKIIKINTPPMDNI